MASSHLVATCPKTRCWRCFKHGHMASQYKISNDQCMSMIEIPKSNRHFNTSARIGSFLYVEGYRTVEANIQKTVMMNLRMNCHTKNIACMTLVQTLSVFTLTVISLKEKGIIGQRRPGWLYNNGIITHRVCTLLFVVLHNAIRSQVWPV